MKDLLLIAACAALLFPCCRPGTGVSEQDRTKPLEHYNPGSFVYDSTVLHQEAHSSADQYQEEDTTVIIRFKEFELTINGIAVEEQDQLKHRQGDSLELFCMLGFGIEGKTVCINAKNIDSLQVEQYYQTSLTIQGEGPHCDLVGWKHYTSEKKPMQEIRPGCFLFDRYSREEAQQFPAISMAKVKQEIKSTCGESWYQAAKNCRSVTDYPCVIGISTYFIHISGFQKNTGKKTSKMIAINSPMGC